VSCQLCPLSADYQVAGYGSKTAKVIFVGEYPQKEDEKQGRPFALNPQAKNEQASAILHAVFKAFRLKPEDVYLALALRCNPNRVNAKAKVKPQYYKTCAVRHLEPELAGCEAPLVVALGELAAKSLLPELAGSYAHARGQWHPVQIGASNKLVRVTFSLQTVQRMSLYEVAQSKGAFTRLQRIKPIGSCGWLFQNDLQAVRQKLKEFQGGLS
jgi:uracil-DNA glycosylase family 4